ncbi:MAG: ppkA [Candidatus Solibacter sp.]|nr:ppkA [Candidatus Solibacter sp.]
MTREAWQQVKDLYDQARPLGPEERRALLDAVCGSGGEVRSEVEALLEAPEPHEDFLEPPPLTGALDALEAKITDSYVGQRLGPYQIAGRIATGGTSTVYEAWRHDGHYEQRVAIKVVRPGMDHSFILGRLHAERQILAGLSHPNIASLLDGGATPSGSPYLVMEFIDGLPITEYCDRQQMSIRQRLALFEQACAGVQHAHRNLVVHRDIKPGNVLVTLEGIPKLLDFGIAKLLHGGADVRQDVTRTGRMLTPEYASPEQMLGEPITTSTDVYSLGVLLYEMLTGRRPYRTAKDSPLEMAKAVCETEPERPSAIVTRRNAELQPETLAVARATVPKRLRGVLAGDIDNIVLMAIRKQPERRYLTVEQFASDIRRYLDDRPVLARKDTLAYRCTKFVRRNTIACIAAALLLVAIVTGAAATVWQARVAQRERARAERRFNEVRQLGRGTLFELEAAIRKLPGSTPVRALLAKRAVELLDGLAKDVGDDISLKLELANAYRRLGAIQGNVLVANLGDRDAALASDRKAVALAESAVLARPRDWQSRFELAQCYFDLSLAMRTDSDGKSRRSLLDKAIEMDEELYAEKPDNPRFARSLAASYQQRGSTLGAEGGDWGADLRDQQSALVISKRLVDAGDVERDSLATLAFSYKKVGAVLLKLKRYPEAAKEYSSALVLDHRILALDPRDPVARFDITFTLSDTGFAFWMQGNRPKALEYYRQVLAIREALEKEDPSNVRVRTGLRSTSGYLGEILRQQGDWKQAVTFHQRAITSGEQLLKTDPTNIPELTQLAWRYVSLGQDYAAGAKWPQAVASDRKAMETIANLKARKALPEGELQSTAAKQLADAEAKLPATR